VRALAHIGPLNRPFTILTVRRAVSHLGALLPKGYPDAFRQIGLFVLADICYETVRGIADGQKAVAFANGREIIDFERATGTFFEPGFQSWQIGERWLIDIANFMYMNSHFVLTTTFLVWLYIKRNDNFYFVRNMFMVAMALALVGYALYPTAPPRLFPEFGFVDTITDFSNVNHDSALVKIFVNPYAAVPSMHIAFALMISIPGLMLSRHTWSKAFWAVYPLIVFWVVVVTANHYWVDAAIGALVAAVAALVAQRLLARARPEAWSFSPAPGEARA
jgi:membrane-associated phospholipid phosphatase